MQPSRDIARLIEIVGALRHLEGGCAWDRAQTFETIVPYTIEEAYEIADAVARRDILDLKEELGDLLLQVVIQARIAEELGCFDFGSVVEAITKKMIRRHPHVFGEARYLDPGQFRALWEAIKAAERAAKAQAKRGRDDASCEKNQGRPLGLLDDVPLALPGLTRAVKLQAKAATVGFDWNDARLVLKRIREEIDELEDAFTSGGRDDIEDEIGDLLFAVANFCRHAHADPEAAVRRANAKFERRFRFIEEALAKNGKSAAEAGLAEMETLWEKAKRRETGCS